MSQKTCPKMVVWPKSNFFAKRANVAKLGFETIFIKPRIYEVFQINPVI